MFSLSDTPPLFHLLFLLFMGIPCGGTLLWVSMQPPPGGSLWFVPFAVVFLAHLLGVPRAVGRIRDEGLLGMKQWRHDRRNPSPDADR
ncbi:hypothetical protein SUDANB121_00310 [Nocardiopsis dassonvillei]|uniref:hypothetical protein n=1 Tax=Nocardiopsis dassonvillei TaxID=2014 RepID=UPI003F57E7E2